MHVWHTRTAHRLSSGYTCKLVCQTTPQTRQFVQTNLKQWLSWPQTVIEQRVHNRFSAPPTGAPLRCSRPCIHTRSRTPSFFSVVPTVHEYGVRLNGIRGSRFAAERSQAQLF